MSGWLIVSRYGVKINEIETNFASENSLNNESLIVLQPSWTACLLNVIVIAYTTPFTYTLTV